MSISCDLKLIEDPEYFKLCFEEVNRILDEKNFYQEGNADLTIVEHMYLKFYYRTVEKKKVRG